MIFLKDILKEGNKKLNKVSEEVKLPLNEKFIKNLEDMVEYLINSQDDKKAKKYGLRAGVGLAAPQIGINKRFFALHFEDFDKINYSFGVVNPKITEKSSNLIYIPQGEGCLSVIAPTVGVTPRYESITWEGHLYDFNLKELIPVKMNLSGYAAIAFQHEFDHLNGVLFTSKEFKTLANATNVFDLEKYRYTLNHEEKCEIYGEKPEDI